MVDFNIGKGILKSSVHISSTILMLKNLILQPKYFSRRKKNSFKSDNIVIDPQPQWESVTFISPQTEFQKQNYSMKHS